MEIELERNSLKYTWEFRELELVLNDDKVIIMDVTYEDFNAVDYKESDKTDVWNSLTNEERQEIIDYIENET